MKTTHAPRRAELTEKQKAEHRRVRELFREWHPSPEELIASGERKHFSLAGEYAALRPFLADLKRLRERQEPTLSEVSARCGIEKSALSRLENGQNQNPTLDTLWRYAAALGRRLVLETETIVSTRPQKRSRA